MINVIHASGGHEFNALLYPDQSPFHRDYFHTQVTNFNQALNSYGQQFMATAKDVYERINDSSALELARRAIRSAKGLFQTNLIVPLRDIDTLQAAQPTMQRWMMANPMIRGMYHDQRCSGFADTYMDVEPKLVGDQHYDYRRVMDGIVVENENDWHVNMYFDEIREGDRELLSSEQFDILDTWSIMELFVKAGEDPTDPFGGKL